MSKLEVRQKIKDKLARKRMLRRARAKQQEKEKKRAEVRKDPLRRFSNFVFVIWTHLHKQPTKLQYQACDHIQKTQGTQLRWFCAFRGFAKSWLSAAYALWKLYHNPELKILVVSANHSRATDFTSFCLRLLEEIPLLQHLAPLKNGRSSMCKFDVGLASASQSASVRSTGINGQLTGSRANLIIADDIEIPTNSATPAKRNKILEGVKEFMSILLPDGELLFLGTPQSEDTVYNKLVTMGVTPTYIPARYPTRELYEEYGQYIMPYLKDRIIGRVGQPTEDERFPERVLKDKEAFMGKSTFNLQFNLSTRMSDLNKYPLKLSDMMFTHLDSESFPERVVWGRGNENLLRLESVGLRGDRLYKPAFISKEWCNYHKKILVIDPSGRGKDETAYAVLGLVNGYVAILDWGGLIGGYNEAVLLSLCAKAKMYHVTKVHYEDNFGDGMFGQLLKAQMDKHYPCSIEGHKEHLHKEKRIIARVEPLLNQHRVVCNIEVYERNLQQLDRPDLKNDKIEDRLYYNGFYQMTRLTAQKGCLGHDDRIDVLSLGCSILSPQVDLNPEMMQRLNEKRRTDKLLEDFAQRCRKKGKGIGRKPRWGKRTRKAV